MLVCWCRNLCSKICNPTLNERRWRNEQYLPNYRLFENLSVEHWRLNKYANFAANYGRIQAESIIKVRRTSKCMLSIKMLPKRWMICKRVNLSVYENVVPIWFKNSAYQRVLSWDEPLNWNTFTMKLQRPRVQIWKKNLNHRKEKKERKRNGVEMRKLF